MSLKKMTARELLAAAEKDAFARIEKGESLRLSPAAKENKEADEATIYLYDAIGSWFGIPAATFVKELNGLKAKTIHLRINSPGGSVFEAEAIQTAIQQHGSTIIAHIDGFAASAATYVAIAAKEVEISDGAFFMIHNSWIFTWDNASGLIETAVMLEKIDGNLVRDYARKTGKTEEEIKDWMEAETYFSAAEALENGFVDRIYSPKEDEKEGENGKKSDESKAKAEVKPKNDGTSQFARERALRLVEVGF
jgi:ATP-dependent Clp protease protease subunit